MEPNARAALAWLEGPADLDGDGYVEFRKRSTSDRAIDNQISRLRKKIEPDPKNPTLIKTVWGGGYTLSSDVTRL